MNLHKTDISDILARFPDTCAFQGGQQMDILICTLGFEQRTYNIIETLFSANKLTSIHFILITYPTNKDDNEKNAQKFEQKKEHFSSYKQIEYDRINFFNQFDNYLKTILKPTSKVLFDISTSASYIIYPVMKALLTYNIDLALGYTEAEFYYPTLEQWEKVQKDAIKENKIFPESYEDAKFLSHGIDDVYSSILFSEMNAGNYPSLLIAIPNFTVRRMNSIIEKDKDLNKTASDNIIWLLGEPPSQNSKWRLDALEKIYNIENVKKQNKKALSTLFYKETIEKLEEIWIENQYNFHLIIGNLGSKMQHIGAFFFMLMHSDIGLLLAEPKEFNSNFYSNGVGDTHQVTFGNVKDLNQVINTYMKFSFKM